MNRTLTALAMAAAFLSGWGVRRQLTEAPSVRASVAVEAVRPPLPGLPGERLDAEVAEFRATLAGFSGKLADLPGLVVPGNTMATRANIHAALRSLDAERIAALAKDFDQDVELDDEEHLFAAGIISRWAETDAAAGLAFTQGAASGRMRDCENTLVPLATALAATNLPLVAAAMAKTRDREAYIIARLDAILPLWEHDAPRVALEKIMAFDTATRNDWFQATCVRDHAQKWAKSDPKAAATWAAAQVEGFTRRMILDQIAQELAKSDAEAARVFFATLTGGDADQLRRTLEEHIQQAFEAARPEEAFDRALTTEAAGKPGARASAVLESWARNDPAAAWRFAAGRTEESGVRVQYLASVIRGSLQSGGVNFTTGIPTPERQAFLSGLPAGPETEAALRALAQGEGHYLTEEVLAFLPASPARDEAQAQLAREKAAQEKQLRDSLAPWTEAAKQAEALPEGEVRTERVARLARFWLQNGGDASAFAWIASRPASERAAGLSDLSDDGWAAGHPEVLAGLVAGLTPDKFPKLDYAGLAASRAVVDPAGSLGWVLSWPGQDGFRADALFHVFRQWAMDEPAAALAAASRLEEKFRTTVQSGVVEGWVPRAPAVAAAWAESLPPGDARDDALGHVYECWNRVQPAGAQAWLARCADLQLVKARQPQSPQPEENP